MRALILVAGAGLALSACGDQAATDVDANISSNLATADIFSNDTTVIDAATGDASNMAADVTYNVGDLNSSGDVRSDGRVDRQTMSRQQASDNAAAAEPAESNMQMETATETNAN